MATINNMMGAGYASSNSKTNNEISELRRKMSDLNKDTSLTAAERKEKQKEYSDQITALSEESRINAGAQMVDVIK